MFTPFRQNRKQLKDTVAWKRRARAASVAAEIEVFSTSHGAAHLASLGHLDQASPRNAMGGPAGDIGAIEADAATACAIEATDGIIPAAKIIQQRGRCDSPQGAANRFYP